MRVIITSAPEKITGGKDGAEYIKMSAISAKDGHAVELFTSKNAFDKFGLDSDIEPATDESFTAFVKANKQYDVSYNERGRLEGIEAL